MGKPPRTKMPAAGVDGDEAVFLELSRELKEEGVRLFNRRDYEGAAFKYDKAVQLLPSGRRVEAAHLRTSIAQCYMRMSPGEFHRAIHECNLALEAAPRYSRALLRRATCFEAMGRPDLAWGDVERVLRWEPSNRAAGVMSERMRAALEEIGVAVPLDREDMQSEGDIASARGEEMRKKSHKHFDSQAEVNEGNNGNHVVLQEEEAASTDGGKGNQAMHLKGKKQKHGDDKQEKQASQMQINGIRNHRNHAEVTETNGLEKEEQNAETKEDTGNKRGQHAAGKKARRGGKQQKNCAVDHGEDNHYKHIEENNIDVKEVVVKDVKLVFGEDIRCAQMPVNCSMSQLRDIVQNKFPSLKALLIKYKDKEEDLVTITSSEELRWANNLADSEGPIRLYVSEVSPVQELGVDGVRKRPSFATLEKIRGVMLENGSIRHDDEHNYYVDDWMVQFAHLLKNHVGFNSDAYLHLHDLGLRLYYEAMEDTTESEEALEVFEVAELKFQEMAALALFNWGHVHMSRARKRPCLPEDSSLEFILEQVKVSYEWACTEYVKAGSMFEEAVKSKSDFFEGLIALGQLQYEQAKLSWYYALACKIDMGTEVLELFNHAEDSMEKGMDMWERMECVHLKGLSKPSKERAILEKMGLEGFMKDIPADEAYEQASSIRSHINILWGTILYERSVVEFNLALPCWEESLTVAMEKFKIGGASPADINVIVKNHCANETTQEGLSFKVEEIVQAWNEMYAAKSWRSGALSSRLQPIFRRRAPKLHHILEHLHYT